MAEIQRSEELIFCYRCGTRYIAQAIQCPECHEPNVLIRLTEKHVAVCGVMGSAGAAHPPVVQEKCFLLGQEIVRRNIVLATGQCPGLPHRAVEGAKSLHGFVVGFSPAMNQEEHDYRYGSPTDGYDLTVFCGDGFMGREVTCIRSCDMVVFVSGQTGTLGELAIALEEGKIVGALLGTGGVADYVQHIYQDICGSKQTGAVVLAANEPGKLLDMMLRSHQLRTSAGRG